MVLDALLIAIVLVCLFVCFVIVCYCKTTAYVGDNKLILILSYISYFTFTLLQFLFYYRTV